jgi:hypothetical protein
MYFCCCWVPQGCCSDPYSLDFQFYFGEGRAYCIVAAQNPIDFTGWLFCSLFHDLRLYYSLALFTSKLLLRDYFFFWTTKGSGRTQSPLHSFQQHVAGTNCKKALTSTLPKKPGIWRKVLLICKKHPKTKDEKQSGPRVPPPPKSRLPQGIATEEQGQDAQRPPSDIEPQLLATSKSPGHTTWWRGSIEIQQRICRASASEIEDGSPCRQKITGAKQPPAWLSSTEICPRDEELEAMRCSDPSPPWPARGSSPSPQIHLSRWSWIAALLTEIMVLFVVIGSDHRSWRRRGRTLLGSRSSRGDPPPTPIYRLLAKPRQWAGKSLTSTPVQRSGTTP